MSVRWKSFAGLTMCLAIFGVLRSSSHAPSASPPPEVPARGGLVVMAWNVENLFDAIDDPLTRDEEYTPDGSMLWDEEDVEEKLRRLARVIADVDGGRGPDILALAEVENREILDRLASHTLLARMGYHHRYLQNSQNFRGIEVALLSRYQAKVRWHPVYRGGRDILSAEFDIQGRKLHVLANHWCSRRGDTDGASEGQRILSARKCRKVADRILEQDEQADILILGDFNDNPEDASVRESLGAVPWKGRLGGSSLYNLTPNRVASPARLSHRFDQIIASKGLFDKSGFSYVPKSCRYIAPPYMLDKKGLPRRFCPFRHTGYSDHFPIAATLRPR